MEVAALAARILAEDGAANYHSAKKKAANQLGLANQKNLPTNAEIEEALLSYQGLFQSTTQQEDLASHRRKAIQAMKLLEQFSPFLVGPLVTGTATSFSEITLHLYFDQPEQVSLFLEENGIPNQYSEKQIRINASETIALPALRFVADQTSFLIVIFMEKDRNMTPISSVSNKPMKMLTLEKLEQLMAKDIA